MAAKRILTLLGDFVEDYEAMALYLNWTCSGAEYLRAESLFTIYGVTRPGKPRLQIASWY